MYKVLYIHGIGGHDATVDIWKKEWTDSIIKGSGINNQNLDVDVLLFDDLFERRNGTRVGFCGLLECIFCWLVLL